MRTRHQSPVYGIVGKGERTKDLARRLPVGGIAVVAHRDLDGVAAEAIIAARAVAVVNIEPFLSGRYPTQGPLALARRGIHLLEAEPCFWHQVEEGERLRLDPASGLIWRDDSLVTKAHALTIQELLARLRHADRNLHRELDRFLDNTLSHAQREKTLLFGPVPVPRLTTRLRDRHALVVVRGQGHRADLRAVHAYIRDFQPVLIGVDGGADALLELGHRPDLVIGDMDSISDQALRCARERVVHAYPDGRAPGMERVRRLGLDASVFPVPGTSEDAALLLAYECRARLIVAVGTHTHVIDFLEKGRPGMASTMLVRLKVGSRLVDAKGVHTLYARVRVGRPIAHLVTAALFVVAATVLTTPLTRGLLQLAWLEFRLRLGL